MTQTRTAATSLPSAAAHLADVGLALAQRLDTAPTDPAGVGWLSIPFARFGGYCRREREVLRDLRVDRPMLFLVLSGTKRVTAGGEEFLCGPGDMAVLPARLPLTVVNSPEERAVYRSILVEFTDTVRDRCQTLLQSVAAPPPAQGLKLSGTAVLHPVRQALAHLLYGVDLPPTPHPAPHHPAISDPLLMEHRLLEVLLALCQAGYAAHVLPASAHTVSCRLRAMVRVAPDTDWTAETVARHLAVSVPTLHRRLRAEGSSLRTLIESVRLEHAHTLLTSGAVSTVTEAALRSGYGSPSRFASRFRQRFGTNPSSV